MKKLFTLLFVAVVAIAARATDYNVPITITVNGVSAEQKGTITVTEHDGLYDFTMKNFMLQNGDTPMGIGNVELKDIKSYKDGNATLLIASKQVSITAGDDPSVGMWMGTILPPVNVDLRGKISGDHLRCYIDIDLTEQLGQVIQVAIGDGYQIANPSFENWHTSTGTYVEPNAWHSFETATGSLAALAGHHITKSEDAHTGQASARIYATSIFGIVANGTMTTGRMNAGAMSATDKNNHAYLDMSSADVDGNGDPFYTTMYSRPDSIATWIKFKQGTPTASFPYATISAIITDGSTRYQDPEDKEYTNVVGKAQNNTIATTGDQWVRVKAPFVYTDNAVEPKAVLVTISTNATPGKGSNNDEVLVDDIQFIYNATVTGLKIKGQSVPNFNSKTTSYEMALTGAITADDIEVTVDSKTAHVIKEVTADAGNYLCTIKAISADMSTISTYQVKVAGNTTGIDNVNANENANANSNLYNIAGQQVSNDYKGMVIVNGKKIIK